MAGFSVAARSASDGFHLPGCACLALALLAASLAAPAAAGADQAARLDRLSATIDNLKASLTAIRRDVEAARAAPEADAPLAPDAPCGAAATETVRAPKVVDTDFKRAPGSPIEAAAAAELDAPAAADGAADIQLRADLALAQLKIAELTEALRSTRANQTALEAELKSLRSLTDAKIKRFLGWPSH
jgi:cell division protein FtsB